MSKKHTKVAPGVGSDEDEGDIAQLMEGMLDTPDDPGRTPAMANNDRAARSARMRAMRTNRDADDSNAPDSRTGRMKFHYDKATGQVIMGEAASDAKAAEKAAAQEAKQPDHKGSDGGMTRKRSEAAEEEKLEEKDPKSEVAKEEDAKTDKKKRKTLRGALGGGGRVGSSLFATGTLFGKAKTAQKKSRLVVVEPVQPQSPGAEEAAVQGGEVALPPAEVATQDQTGSNQSADKAAERQKSTLASGLATQLVVKDAEQSAGSEQKEGLQLEVTATAEGGSEQEGRIDSKAGGIDLAPGSKIASAEFSAGGALDRQGSRTGSRMSRQSSRMGSRMARQSSRMDMQRQSSRSGSKLSSKARIGSKIASATRRVGSIKALGAFSEANENEDDDDEARIASTIASREDMVVERLQPRPIYPSPFCKEARAARKARREDLLTYYDDDFQEWMMFSKPDKEKQQKSLKKSLSIRDPADGDREGSRELSGAGADLGEVSGMVVPLTEEEGMVRYVSSADGGAESADGSSRIASRMMSQESRLSSRTGSRMGSVGRLSSASTVSRLMSSAKRWSGRSSGRSSGGSGRSTGGSSRIASSAVGEGGRVASSLGTTNRTGSYVVGEEGTTPGADGDSSPQNNFVKMLSSGGDKSKSRMMSKSRSIVLVNRVTDRFQRKAMVGSGGADSPTSSGKNFRSSIRDSVRMSTLGSGAKRPWQTIHMGSRFRSSMRSSAKSGVASAAKREKEEKKDEKEEQNVNDISPFIFIEERRKPTFKEVMRLWGHPKAFAARQAGGRFMMGYDIFADCVVCGILLINSTFATSCCGADGCFEKAYPDLKNVTEYMMANNIPNMDPNELGYHFANPSSICCTTDEISGLNLGITCNLDEIPIPGVATTVQRIGIKSPMLNSAFFYIALFLIFSPYVCCWLMLWIPFHKKYMLKERDWKTKWGRAAMWLFGGVQFLIGIDVMVFTKYLFYDFEATIGTLAQFLVYYERLRKLMECMGEAVPQAFFQLILFQQDMVPIHLLLIAMFSSLSSICVNFYELYRGAKLRSITVLEFTKSVMVAGLGTVPYVAGISAGKLKEVSFEGIEFTNDEKKQVLHSVSRKKTAIQSLNLNKTARLVCDLPRILETNPGTLKELTAEGCPYRFMNVRVLLHGLETIDNLLKLQITHFPHMIQDLKGKNDEVRSIDLSKPPPKVIKKKAKQNCVVRLVLFTVNIIVQLLEVAIRVGSCGRFSIISRKIIEEEEDRMPQDIDVLIIGMLLRDNRTIEHLNLQNVNLNFAIGDTREQVIITEGGDAEGKKKKKKRGKVQDEGEKKEGEQKEGDETQVATKVPVKKKKKKRRMRLKRTKIKKEWRDNKVQSAMWQHLKHSTEYEPRTQITRLLCFSRTLLTADLRNTGFTFAEHCQPLIDAISENQTLLELRLSATFVIRVQDLRGGPSCSRYVDLSKVPVPSDSMDVEILSTLLVQNRKAVSLNMAGVRLNRIQSGRVIQMWVANKKIERVNLRNTNVEYFIAPQMVEVLDAIKNNPRLRKVRITKRKEHNIRELRGSRKDKEAMAIVDLVGAPPIPVNDIDVAIITHMLEENKKVEVLALSCLPIVRDMVAVQAHQKLAIGVGKKTKKKGKKGKEKAGAKGKGGKDKDEKQVVNDGLDRYGQNLPKDLSEFSCMEKDKDTGVLPRFLPHSITPETQFIDPVLTLLQSSSTLLDCHLVGCGLHVEHAPRLIAAFKENDIMQRLWVSSDLCCLYIQDLRGGEDKSICQCNDFSTGRLTVEAVDIAIICALLESNRTCEELSLFGVECTEMQLNQMLTLISESKTLKHLDFRGTGMKDHPIGAFLEAVGSNDVLLTVAITDNFELQIQQLRGGADGNRTCDLSPGGKHPTEPVDVAIVCALLKENRLVKRLLISEVVLTVEQVEQVISPVISCRWLEYVDLRGTHTDEHLTEAKLRRLVNALKPNSTMCTMRITPEVELNIQDLRGAEKDSTVLDFSGKVSTRPTHKIDIYVICVLLEQNMTVRTLNLNDVAVWQNEQHTPVLKMVGESPKLESLNVRGCGMSADNGGKRELGQKSWSNSVSELAYVECNEWHCGPETEKLILQVCGYYDVI
jgi:hypothetical protein